MKTQVIGLICALSLLAACSKDPSPDRQPAFGFERPAYFPQPIYQFTGNPVTEAGFNLGRRLFYDPLLSLNGTISCGSCHAQVHAFADHGKAFSTGIYGRQGKRNAPGMANMAWNPSFMWDGGINHIEVMPVGPLTDTVEMGESIISIVKKLNNNASYRRDFKQAFGGDTVTDQHMLQALAQFMGMMVSADSKYDQYRKGQANLSTSEMAGLGLFRLHCSSCHTEPLFSDYSFRNNGIDTQFKDPGRMRITQDIHDQGKFKVPSLRNVALTNPYMHDGRFATLSQVMDHYTQGVKSSPTLDPSLQGGIPLSEQEKQQIISFLLTLTDYTFLSDRRFAEPLIP